MSQPVHEVAFDLLADSAPMENEWLRPAVHVDDSWIDRTVAEAERLARARLVEGVRRQFYREGLMRPGGRR